MTTRRDRSSEVGLLASWTKASAMSEPLHTPLEELIPDRIWLKKYPVHYAGLDFHARATVIRLSSGDLVVHSPSPIDGALAESVRRLGRVAHLVAPGSYHYFHVAAWQEAFPEATVWICPGVERKQPDLEFDWFLSDGENIHSDAKTVLRKAWASPLRFAG